jgi:hypothetical protein
MKTTLFFLFFTAVLVACNTAPKETVVPQKEICMTPLAIPVLPDEIVFCGQTVNLKDEDIRERLDREILVNAYYQSATLQALKRANRFFPVIEPILKEKGIPDDFKYLAVIESNLVQAVSPAGAQGFWQFMPGTAKERGLIMNGEVDERLNIEKSTAAACDYLTFAHDTLKDWVLAAASYNRGIGGVRSDMRWQGTTNYFDTHMNSETGRYVYRILAMKLIFEDPEAYGYNLEETELYEPFKTTAVTVRSSIDNLAEWSQNKGINYKILIKLNPWILGNKLTVKKVPFKIKLPHKTFNLKPYEAYQ